MAPFSLDLSICFSPAYQSTAETPLHAGCQTTTLPLRAANNWQIDLADVRAAIRENTRYIVINQPFNPAGTLMSHDAQRELAAIARAHGIYVLSDEVYRLLEHDPADGLPAMADLYERGLSAVTLSKPWGACGVTIGWLAFQDLSVKGSAARGRAVLRNHRVPVAGERAAGRHGAPGQQRRPP